MKKYQIIFHIDLNAFFASCEEARNPSLKTLPIGIGPRSDRGILTTANYVARKFGVRSAMSVYEAKKCCPNLKIIPTNFPLYEAYSHQFFSYLRTISIHLEPASIDEGYLDVTDSLNGKHPLDLAKEIQDTLYRKYQLPVSIGIAPNMFLAKMASDMKKPLGITILRKRDVPIKLWPLPIENMHGIGKKTVPSLKLLGINTIGDLANYHSKDKLSRFLGNQTESFIKKAQGIDSRVVDPKRSETIQSIGNSKTYEDFLHTYESILKALTELTETVVRRLHEHQLSTKTIAVHARFSDYSHHSKHFTLPHPTQIFYEIIEIVEYLFDELYLDQPIHLLGVTAINLNPEAALFKQISIFDTPSELSRDEHINKILESINANYDHPILKKGF